MLFYMLLCVSALWVVVVILWFRLRAVDEKIRTLRDVIESLDEDLSQQGWNIDETRKCIENIKANHSALANACADRFSNLD